MQVRHMIDRPVLARVSALSPDKADGADRPRRTATDIGQESQGGMTPSARANRRRSQEVATHLFRVGQMVRMRRSFGVAPKAAELFRIMGTLPARDNSPQYRIRSDDERHERVATEDSLEPVDESSILENATLHERTFGYGQGTKAQQPGAPEAEAGEGPAKA